MRSQGCPRPAQLLKAPVAVAWGALAAALGTTSVGLAVGLAMTLASTAFSLSQAARQKKKMKAMLAGLDEGRTEMIKNPLAPRRLVYGECLVSGVITFFYQKPGQDGMHYLVLTLASHPLQEIGQIRFDNQPAAAWVGTNVNSGPFKGMIDVNKALGVYTGERNTPWESQIGTSVWSPQHLGKGIARLHLRYKWDSDKFPSGMPNVTAMVKGAKVYDPRDTSQSPTNPATWKYSNNSALCAAHFLHIRKNVPYSRIVKGALITAANVCDETVPKKTGGTERRYTTNGVYIYDQNPLAALEELAETMAGSIVDAGGTWTIKAGAWTAPVVNLDDSDIVSEFRVSPRFTRQDTYNGVRGTYFSPVNEWATSSITPESTNAVLDLSHWAIGRMNNGAFHSQHLVMYAKAGGQPYAGRFSVRLQVSPTEWHHHYHSPHDQTQHHFTLHQGWGNVMNIEVGLYKSGTAMGTPVNPIEAKLVPVIKNGQDGLPGAPGGGGGMKTLTLESSIPTLHLPGGGSYPQGTVVNLQAPYNIWYGSSMRTFQGWQCYSGGASNWLSAVGHPMTSVTMHGDCTVRANYSYY